MKKKMLLNVSHNDPEITKKINQEVGKPFTLKQRFQLKGIGSPKLFITASSIQIHNLLVLDNRTNTCNIELRPHGIIVGFGVKLETYALVIPFFKLNVYKGRSDEYSIYRDSYFIKFRAKPTDSNIHKFVKKLLDFKADNTPTSIEDL